MATADLSVIPLGTPTASVGEYLAEIARRLESETRVRAHMHGGGTSLEGETADILAVVAEMHSVPFEMGLLRVYTVLKLDERRDRPGQTVADKEHSVRERLEGGAVPERPGS
jgi:uncharacterized protein (TIGR00106 family)